MHNLPALLSMLNAWLNAIKWDEPERVLFFSHLIERHAFRDVDPAKGRFRSFLIACLNHRVADVGDRNRAQKRGGGATLLDLDAARADELYELEARKDWGADRLFDRRWALTVLEQALERLSAEQAAAGKAAMFARLRSFLTDASGNPAPNPARHGWNGRRAANKHTTGTSKRGTVCRAPVAIPAKLNRRRPAPRSIAWWRRRRGWRIRAWVGLVLGRETSRGRWRVPGWNAARPGM